jgi:energy-coupling factor transport system substrate-specific component
VSWPLAAFVILGLGLLAGFAWYERTRPDARTVALIGTLAAFAALGRIAFAAVPNVKPTSDIVLISGYALGGAPGYVVGALAALTSNFFFGQGPWTPWQMAGWGATGVAGALLGRLTRGRIGRLPLAGASFVLGFGFTALQDAGDWVTYSDHSLAQLGIYVGRGIGFDLVHACGCFGFAMLFGPALIRTLARFRARIEVTWLPPASGVAAAALASTVIAIGASGSGEARAAGASTHASPITYLLQAQNSDGGFGSARGQKSDTLDSGWAAFALDAAGSRDPEVVAAFVRDERYLAATAVRQERGAGDIERTALAAELIPFARRGFDVTDFGGLHLVSKLRHLLRPDGSVAEQTNLTAFWILAARPAGIRVGRRTITWVVEQQDRDGGFNYATSGGQSDIDDTGAVLEALAGSGETHTIRRAVRYIHEHQNRDGGFGMQPGDPSNAQSTSFAISGLIAVAAPPGDMHRDGSPTAANYLRSLIQADGSVDYARANAQTPVWVTAEAEIALAKGTL